MIRSTIAICMLLLALPAFAQTVKIVAPDRMDITGGGAIPLHLSSDWSTPLPSVTRAVIVVHGALRNADVYMRSAERAREAAAVSAETTLLIVPQFLTGADIAAHNLPDAMLRWDTETWKDGRPADGPSRLSSFDVFDALLTRLSDRAAFPALRHIVVAGHSAGAQVVQRYAVAGRGEDGPTKRGIAVRYVIANPSTYLWFGDFRPRPTDNCPAVDRWKYGPTGAPPYVVGSADDLEARYIRRDAIYLLGDKDVDPNHPQLDKSCAGQAQGENRYNRGMQHLFYLEGRHPNLVRHRIFSVPGIGHDGAGMFASVCGKAALFDTPGCVGM